MTTVTLGEATHDKNHFADCWVKTEGLCTIETQRLMTERDALPNGVDKCRLDDLVQRKHVEIHVVLGGNKWMGSSDLMI